MGKESIRATVWDRLEAEGFARFPYPPHGRIPNFDGADEAANAIATLDAFVEATTMKCNPDAPQRPVRRRALAEGTVVYMAVPRLQAEHPFLELDPAEIDDLDHAATIGGAADLGRPVSLEDMPPIDAIVVGAVAVDEDGRRIGKGEGYSDLEFALLLEHDIIDRDVTVVTTVHPLQTFDEPLPADNHDVPVDIIGHPTTIKRARNRPNRPTGIDWQVLGDDLIESIPALEQLSPD